MFRVRGKKTFGFRVLGLWILDFRVRGVWFDFRVWGSRFRGDRSGMRV